MEIVEKTENVLFIIFFVHSYQSHRLPSLISWNKDYALRCSLNMYVDNKKTVIKAHILIFFCYLYTLFMYICTLPVSETNYKIQIAINNKS